MNSNSPMTDTHGAPLRIVVMAGGTGGHVFPALAVADQLRARGVDVSWLGTRRGLEAELAPAAGYPMDYIRVTGLRGKGKLSLLLAPLKLALALWQGLAVMRRVRPAAVLGMGGFVAGPGGLAAWLMRRPLLIHEQNARAGYTNRLLAPLARRVMTAYPGAFSGRADVLHTGNPLRAEFVSPPLVSSPEPDRPLRLLVVGGSLGAERLNEVVPKALAALVPEARPEVWHQAGPRNIDTARATYRQAGVSVKLTPFIDDMVAAYQWADLVLCRAGAMTVAELAAAGVASILVPYPFAADDHQTANARYLADGDAAVLLPQSQLSAERLVALLKELTPAVLKKMAAAAHKLALLDATEKVVEQCLILAGTEREVAHG